MSDAEGQTADIEAACRRYYADYPAALWRYLTEGAAIDYDALGCWTFPMLLIIGMGDSAILSSTQIAARGGALHAHCIKSSRCGSQFPES